MLNLKYPRKSIDLLLLTISSFLLVTLMNARAHADDFALPTGFSSIKMGMGLSDFKKLRPQAVSFSKELSAVLGEGEAPSSSPDLEIYTETLRDAQFSDLQCIFAEGKLQVALFAQVGTANKIGSSRDSFLRNTLAKYGCPTHLGIAEDSYNLPMLFWEKKGCLLTVAFTPKSAAGNAKNDQLLLAISTGLYSTPYKNFAAAAVTPEEARLFLAPVQNFIKQTLKVKQDVPILLGKAPVPAQTSVELVREMDFAPLWSNEGLYYVTKRPVVGESSQDTQQPSRSEALESVVRPLYKIVSAASGNAPQVLVRSPIITNLLAYTPVNHRLAWNSLGVVYVLDVKSGKLGRLNDGSRVQRYVYDWDVTGDLVTLDGTHSPSDQLDPKRKYDRDIFVTRVAKNLSSLASEETWCIAQIPGSDTLPIFYPDGKNVIFAHRDPYNSPEEEFASKGKSNWSLWSVATEKSYLAPDYTPPTKIVDNLPKPDRISFFPNGREILVSYASIGTGMKAPAPDIFNLLTKERKPITIVQPEISKANDASTFVPQEVGLNPNGTKLIFRAIAKSPDSSGFISCIYTAKLDGAQVSRLTETRIKPIEPYKYLAAGLTGINLWESR